MFFRKTAVLASGSKPREASQCQGLMQEQTGCATSKNWVWPQTEKPQAALTKPGKISEDAGIVDLNLDGSTEKSVDRTSHPGSARPAN